MADLDRLLRYGNWQYALVTDEDADGDGTWDWLVLRLPAPIGEVQVLGMGKADSREEAERLADLALHAEWEQIRVGHH